MNFRTLSLVVLAACKGGGGTPTDSGLPSGAPTGDPSWPTTATPPVGDAACAVDAGNGLRVHCTASLDAPGWATVRMTAAGAPERSFLSTAAGSEVALHAWGLKADTEYTWTIGEASGRVTTGSIPAALQALSVTHTGAPSGFDAVLMPVGCDGTYFVVIDDEDDIVWYESTNLYNNGMDAYEWSQADRSLLVGKDGNVEEIHVSGERLHSWSGYAGSVHHDLSRWSDFTYLLYEYQVGGISTDGIHVYEGDTLVDSFELEDHYTIVASGGGGGPGPGGGQFAHSNGINVNADGDLILSMRTLSSVMSIDADPASPTFLDIQWVANGKAASGLPYPDYASSGTSYADQHNASFVDGALYLFDNLGGGSESRAGKYSLNASGGIDTLETWGVGASCNVEGGAIPLADGGVLATCAATRDVFQFEPGSTTATYTLRAACGGGGQEAINRAIPVWIE